MSSSTTPAEASMQPGQDVRAQVLSAHLAQRFIPAPRGEALVSRTSAAPRTRSRVASTSIVDPQMSVQVLGPHAVVRALTGVSGVAVRLSPKGDEHQRSVSSARARDRQYLLARVRHLGVSICTCPQGFLVLGEPEAVLAALAENRVYLASVTGRGCDAPGCPAPHHGDGLCASHYARRARTGQTDLSPVRFIGGPERGCDEEGCSEAHYGKGCCQRHYWLRHGRQNMHEAYRARRDALGIAPGPRLGPRGTARWSEAEVIAALQQVAEQVGRDGVVTFAQYADAATLQGLPSTDAVKRRFGSWGAGVLAAGLRPARVGRSRVTRATTG